MFLPRDLRRHAREFLSAFRNHKWERMDDGGVLFPVQHAIICGEFVHGVNGRDWRTDKNLIVTEGLNNLLDVNYHDAAKTATWYLALHSGNVTVLANWTAANYTANATEITSGSEGYSEGTRQAFVEAAASAGAITNSASKAAFTIATATSITVWGAGMLSSSTKGGTSGVLNSASKFSASRTLYNTDVFSLGYTISLTSS